MDLFPISDGNRSVPSAPGARKAVVSVEDVAEIVRDVLEHLESEGLGSLFPTLASGSQVDDDPDLGPVLGLCGSRLLANAELAILPPALRFNCERSEQVYRIFAAGRWVNGVNGYALAPSEWRPELSVWAYSEGRLLVEGEWGPAADWLAEFVAPLRQYTLGADDPAERAQVVAELSEHSATLWESIGGDLRPPQPRPDWRVPRGCGTAAWGWHGEVVAGRAEGVWTFGGDGVVRRQEVYAEGRRHGPATRWHVIEELAPQLNLHATDDPELDPERDLERDPFVYRQGHIEREGGYVDGAAHGPFRFFNEAGQPLQEGAYEHGWPEGRWTVHPAATRGLAEPAFVDYASGVPVSSSIPPPAFDSVELTRDGGERITLARLTRGHRGVVLVNCADTPVHDLPERAAKELAERPDLLVLGVHPDTPGRGRLAGRALDVVADPTGGLTRAYRATPSSWDPQPPGLYPLTCLDAEGGFRTACGLERPRFSTRFLPVEQAESTT